MSKNENKIATTEALKAAAPAKIEYLNAEEETRRVAFRAAYFQHGWSTAPSDRPTAEAAIVKLYARLGKTAPAFVWFDSPAAASACVKESTGEDVRLSGTDGCLDAPWACFYMFGSTLRDDIYGANLEHLLEWDALIRSTGPCYSYGKFCLMTERPIKASFDDRELLHALDGPALLYRDGYKIYAVNGVRLAGGVSDAVAEDIVERPWVLTAELIAGVESEDLRSIMQERWCYEHMDNAGDRVGSGGGRWLDATGAVSIHEDVYRAYTKADGDDAILMRALLRATDGKQYLCCSDSSTDRVYYIRVSSDAKTCEEGHMSVNGGVKDSDIVASS